MRETILQAALKYAEMGFSVIPVQKNKKPYITWEKYQHQKPTPEQIRTWWDKYPNANVAIVTGPISGISVVDIDSDEAREVIEKQIPSNLVTPISQTPRSGYHYYFQSQNGLSNAAGFIPKADYRGEGGYIIAPPSEGYTWIPELSIDKVPPTPLPESIYNLLYSQKHQGLNIKTISLTTSDHKIPVGKRDDMLFHIANHLFKGKMPNREIIDLLQSIARYCCEEPFPEKEIIIKINSVLKRAENQDRAIAQELRQEIEAASGTITTSVVHNWLQATTRKEKKAINMALLRLVEEGVLEKTGNRAGEYRKVEREFEVVKFEEVTGDPIDIKLPLGVDQFIDILPKDLIVYAGSPNAGKTTLLLETARLNMDKHNIWYFSTEMGRYNAKRRLAKYEHDIKWKINFVDEFPNFYDVIQPDDFNIIDYVEESEGEYYKIPSVLAKIQKRLKNGIALVALQKDPDKKHGVGGHMTLAKPALFCAIDHKFPETILTIEKAKNYKDKNPHGYQHSIKIVGGINIKPQGYWRT